MICTLGNMRAYVQSELNDTSGVILLSADIDRVLNDGYRDVAVKSKCIEKMVMKRTIENSNFVSAPGMVVSYISLVGYDELIFENTTDIEWEDISAIEWQVVYTTGTPPNRTLIKMTPAMIGHVGLDGVIPQFWFQWGDQIFIEPLPEDVYVLKVYYADYPESIYTGDALQCDGDIPFDLPEEFRQSVPEYALYVLSAKLKRWNQVAYYYNTYIRNLVGRKELYTAQHPDTRFGHELPNTVTFVRANG